MPLDCPLRVGRQPQESGGLRYGLNRYEVHLVPARTVHGEHVDLTAVVALNGTSLAAGAKRHDVTDHPTGLDLNSVVPASSR